MPLFFLNVLIKHEQFLSIIQAESTLNVYILSITLFWKSWFKCISSANSTTITGNETSKHLKGNRYIQSRLLYVYTFSHVKVIRTAQTFYMYSGIIIVRSESIFVDCFGHPYTCIFIPSNFYTSLFELNTCMYDKMSRAFHKIL